jgi:hypothetical protein
VEVAQVLGPQVLQIQVDQEPVAPELLVQEHLVELPNSLHSQIQEQLLM